MSDIHTNVVMMSSSDLLLRTRRCHDRAEGAINVCPSLNIFCFVKRSLYFLQRLVRDFHFAFTNPNIASKPLIEHFLPLSFATETQSPRQRRVDTETPSPLLRSFQLTHFATNIKIVPSPGILYGVLPSVPGTSSICCLQAVEPTTSPGQRSSAPNTSATQPRTRPPSCFLSEDFSQATYLFFRFVVSFLVVQTVQFQLVIFGSPP